ncbi:hypothetical protein QE152_g7781 [Popillia japonica]|uniref:Uncharacterized protein n=1 Tax=Popillia japonica TaxID=7064 RepID=A0AAW1MCF1_POPJA
MRNAIKEVLNNRLLKQVFPDNKIAKTTKKIIRKMSTSSSDTEESIALEADEISDDFSDVGNVHLITDDNQIHQNDFVLVKFPTKMTAVYYIGEVLECLNLNEFQIKYLRLDRSDLVSKLPAPNSARTSSLLTFIINLSSYVK